MYIKYIHIVYVYITFPYSLPFLTDTWFFCISDGSRGTFSPPRKGNICVSNCISAAHFTELLLISSQLTELYYLEKNTANTESGKEGWVAHSSIWEIKACLLNHNESMDPLPKEKKIQIYNTLCSPSGNIELIEHELLKINLSKSHQYCYRQTPTSVKKLLAFQSPIFHDLSPSGWETLLTVMPPML